MQIPGSEEEPQGLRILQTNSKLFANNPFQPSSLSVGKRLKEFVPFKELQWEEQADGDCGVLVTTSDQSQDESVAVLGERQHIPVFGWGSSLYTNKAT